LDYAERRVKQLEYWRAQNGKQGGDPAKLARALIALTEQERPPPARAVPGDDGPAAGLAFEIVSTLSNVKHEWIVTVGNDWPPRCSSHPIGRRAALGVV
jgi:hypothetical protein